MSPLRLACVVVLTVISVAYLAVMINNAVPHGDDKARQEQPFHATVPTLPSNR